MCLSLLFKFARQLTTCAFCRIISILIVVNYYCFCFFPLLFNLYLAKFSLRRNLTICVSASGGNTLFKTYTTFFLILPFLSFIISRKYFHHQPSIAHDANTAFVNPSNKYFFLKCHIPVYLFYCKNFIAPFAVCFFS